MDIEKLFKEFVEKEWHDGHEPQGEHDHYDEDEDLDEKFEKEARSYIDAKKKDKEKKDYKKKYGREPFSFSGKHMSKKHSMGIAAEFDPELDEGYKDLPPHLQKLVKKIEKKQKDWNKQNPNAKIKTLVYNPDTGKPDIEIKENTMKLVDTVKQVLDEHCGVCGEQGIEEDSNPDKEGTQGDNKEYQAKRAKVLKKYGVASCAFIKDEKTKKQCFQDLDDAHVADHEEQVKTEDVSEAFWKVNIPDMPPIFVEAGSASEIKKDMRTKLRPDVVKELAIERVSKSEMIRKYRELAKGGGSEDEEETSESTIDEISDKTALSAIRKRAAQKHDAMKKAYAAADRGSSDDDSVARANKASDSQSNMTGMLRKKRGAKYSPGEAQRYYKDKGRAPEGWRVDKGRVVKEEDEHGKTIHDKLVKASQKVADDYNKGAKPKTEVKATGTGAKEGGHCESTDSKLYSSVKKMMKK